MLLFRHILFSEQNNFKKPGLYDERMTATCCYCVYAQEWAPHSVPFCNLEFSHVLADLLESEVPPDLRKVVDGDQKITGSTPQICSPTRHETFACLLPSAPLSNCKTRQSCSAALPDIQLLASGVCSRSESPVMATGRLPSQIYFGACISGWRASTYPGQFLSSVFTGDVGSLLCLGGVALRLAPYKTNLRTLTFNPQPLQKRGADQQTYSKIIFASPPLLATPGHKMATDGRLARHSLFLPLM